jgi:hypothetical protein
MGASCAREITRSGCTRTEDDDDVSKAEETLNMRSDSDPVNTSKKVEQGEMQSEVIDSVSCVAI